MKEIREIIRAYDQCLKEGKRMALASVVHLEGSSYRRPGARMLVDDEGKMTGAISGGCLEGDALRKALLVISQQHPKLVSYDTSEEEDMSIGVQLGCAGIIQVLFEPIDPSDPHNPVQLLRHINATRQSYALLTLIDRNAATQPGTCLLMQQDGTVFSKLEGPLREDCTRLATEALGNARSLHKVHQTYQAFIEFIPPPVSLVVVGGGNDAIPLVNLANELGWDARVVDGRATHAQAGRFEAACQVLVSKPESVLHQLHVDQQTVFVLMTHNYQYDLAMLANLLPMDIPYIGLLGPKKKLNRMLDELREKGMDLNNDMLEKIYGPVGLDIGAETPEEIALSIIAEIKAVLSQRRGTSLREKPGPIHATTPGGELHGIE